MTMRLANEEETICQSAQELIHALSELNESFVTNGSDDGWVLTVRTYDSGHQTVSIENTSFEESLPADWFEGGFAANH